MVMDRLSTLLVEYLVVVGSIGGDGDCDVSEEKEQRIV